MSNIKQSLSDIENFINSIGEKIDKLSIDIKGNIRQDISGIKTSLSIIRKKVGIDEK